MDLGHESDTFLDNFVEETKLEEVDDDIEPVKRASPYLEESSIVESPQDLIADPDFVPDPTEQHSDDFINDAYDEQNPKPNRVDQIVNELKQRKRRKVYTPTVQEMEERTDKLIDKMQKARDDDLRVWEEGKPALSKLKFIDEVVHEVSKPVLEQVFLDKGILIVFNGWLSPMPDNSLVNNRIRNSILELCSRMTISRDNLRESEFGRTLVCLWKHPDENDANKKLMQKIVQNALKSLLGFTS